MLKSHIYILQYLEEPDLPSTFQNEPVSFRGKKKNILFVSVMHKKGQSRNIFSHDNYC